MGALELKCLRWRRTKSFTYKPPRFGASTRPVKNEDSYETGCFNDINYSILNKLYCISRESIVVLNRFLNVCNFFKWLRFAGILYYITNRRLPEIDDLDSIIEIIWDIVVHCAESRKLVYLSFDMRIVFYRVFIYIWFQTVWLVVMWVDSARKVHLCTGRTSRYGHKICCMMRLSF